MTTWSTKSKSTQQTTVVNNNTVPNAAPTKIRLGIWGSPSAGKTIYAVMLHYYLMNQSGSPWRVRTKDKDTSDFVKDGQKAILLRKEMLPATEVTANPKVYSYILNSKNKSDLVDIELNFFDLSGEAYTIRKDDTFIPDPETGEQVTIPQYLNKCHGILFLISPLGSDSPLSSDGTPDSLGLLLQELVDDMMQDWYPQSQRLEQYISICITKADHDEVRDYFDQHLPEESLLKILGANYTMQWFDNNFIVAMEKDNKKFVASPDRNHRCKVFYVSPFGTYKDEKTGEIVSPIDTSTSYNSTPPTESYTPPTSNNPFSSNNSMSGNIPQAVGGGIVKPDAPAFTPINMITPIEWLVRGILQNPPQIKK